MSSFLWIRSHRIYFRHPSSLADQVASTLDVLKLRYTNQQGTFIVSKTHTVIQVKGLPGCSLLSIHFASPGSTAERYIASILAKRLRHV